MECNNTITPEPKKKRTTRCDKFSGKITKKRGKNGGILCFIDELLNPIRPVESRVVPTLPFQHQTLPFQHQTLPTQHPTLLFQHQVILSNSQSSSVPATQPQQYYSSNQLCDVVAASVPVVDPDNMGELELFTPVKTVDTLTNTNTPRSSVSSLFGSVLDDVDFVNGCGWVE